MCLHVDQFPPELIKLDLHIWDSFPEIEKRNMQKASLDFRDLFLVDRGYIQRLFYKMHSKCHFFLDLCHVHHKSQTYLYDVMI